MGNSEYYIQYYIVNAVKSSLTLTNNSLGVGLASGSFKRHESTNCSASAENRPSGVSLGAGSFTMCCKSSRMLIVIPPPWRLTPLDLRFSFLSVFFLDTAAEIAGRWLPGLEGERVPSRSERSESSESESAKGNRPRASSIKLIPNDHTSDFTVYCAPCMRSG